MGKALKAVSGCIAIAVGVVFIGVQVVGQQTGKKLDYSSWEKEGWFQKEEVSDAMKAGLAMLTQVCLEGAPCSLCITMKQVESVFHYTFYWYTCAAGSAFCGRLSGWTGSGVQVVTGQWAQGVQQI